MGEEKRARVRDSVVEVSRQHEGEGLVGVLENIEGALLAQLLPTERRCSSQSRAAPRTDSDAFSKRREGQEDDGDLVGKL